MAPKKKNRMGKRQRDRRRTRRMEEEAFNKRVPTGGDKIAHSEADDEEIGQDVQIIQHLLERKDWQIPDEAYELIPKKMTLVAINKKREAGHVVDAEHSADTCIRAAGLLARLSRENRQRLISAARLVQINQGKQADQHTHIHRDNVLIVIPHNDRDDLSQLNVTHVTHNAISGQSDNGR